MYRTFPVYHLRPLFSSALALLTPKKLVEHLYREEDGTVCVDKSFFTSTKEDSRQFYFIVHNKYYFKCADLYDTTIYFEVGENNQIIGGAYNQNTKQKLSRQIIVATDTSSKAPYIYEVEEIERLKKIIDNA